MTERTEVASKIMIKLKQNMLKQIFLWLFDSKIIVILLSMTEMEEVRSLFSD